jgi:hypothetical protein
MQNNAVRVQNSVSKILFVSHHRRSSSLILLFLLSASPSLLRVSVSCCLATVAILAITIIIATGTTA